jgi:hypothetical protein
MDAGDGKLTRPAFWCGVLNAEVRPVAAGVLVRTVRGAYTAGRPPEPQPQEAAEPALPLSHVRNA